jgi:NitT/TauT family transport system substrate-binding protein
LEITEFAAGINTVDAVVTQQADIGMLADYAAVNRIGNTAENTNLQFITRIATNDGKSETKLYVNPDKIKSLEDLAGAGFVTLPGTVWDYWTAKTYEAAGIEESNQNILNADSAASAVAILVNGEGDAFWASGTNAQKVAEAGFEPLISTEDLSLYTDQYFITTSDYVNENEAVVERFLQALQEIVQWTADNTDEAATIINQETGYDADQFKLDYEAVTLTIDFPQSTVDHLNDIKTWAVEKGSFNDYTIEDFVNTEPLKNAISGVDTFK